jgi:hypothetical protein
MNWKTKTVLVAAAFVAASACPAFAQHRRAPYETPAYNFGAGQAGPYNAYGTQSVDPPNPSGNIDFRLRKHQGSSQPK